MFFDVDHLLSYAQTNRERYLTAKPFPHLVIDNFFPDCVLDEALRDFPSPGDCTWREFKDSRHVKFLSQGDARLAPSIRHVLSQLRTSEFLAFLEILCGMEGLVADPHSGGCHETPPRGFLEVHVDASWNERLALYTGINLFVYLNKDWSEEFGGHLELWDTDCTECQTRILPVFNRMVIFSSGERTFHGHPLPLRCPEGVGRKSLAANFCLSRRPQHQTRFRRSAVYKANPSHRLSPNLLAQMLTPPIISEQLRRAKRKRKSALTAC